MNAGTQNQYHIFSFHAADGHSREKKMRQQHGDRFEDLSYALGGYSSRQEEGVCIDGLIERWKPNMDAVRVIIQFAMKMRRPQADLQGTEEVEDEMEEWRQLRILSPSP